MTVVLQKPQMNISVTIKLVEVTRTILANLRNNGFENSLADATVIAEELEIPCVFPTKRQRRAKRQFDYEMPDEQIADAKE